MQFEESIVLEVDAVLIIGEALVKKKNWNSNGLGGLFEVEMV